MIVYYILAFYKFHWAAEPVTDDIYEPRFDYTSEIYERSPILDFLPGTAKFVLECVYLLPALLGPAEETIRDWLIFIAWAIELPLLFIKFVKFGLPSSFKMNSLLF